MYKIMLADDEGIVIDSLKFIIEKEFKDICEVQYAKTGRSVIELAESFRPDIAVMDIQMPGINGIDAMKEIRRTNNHTCSLEMRITAEEICFRLVTSPSFTTAEPQSPTRKPPRTGRNPCRSVSMEA